MRVEIRAHKVEVTQNLRDHVTRRLGFALSRFANRIGRTIVRFSRSKGPLGNGDQCCQIDVSLTPETICVENTDVDSFAALNGAAERIARAVARALERDPNSGKGL